MTMVSIGAFRWPRPSSTMSGAMTIGQLETDASGEKAAFIVQAPKTGSIRKIGFAIDVVTTGGNTDARIETVSAGLPSGTLWATNTNVTVAISATGWQLSGALTADASVTKGDILAVVFAWASGDYRFATYEDDAEPDFPYNAHYIASWTKGATGAPILYLEYSDGSTSPITGCWPIVQTSALVTFNNTSTPDEIGVRFQVPGPVRVSGVWLHMDGDAACDIVLYDSDGSTALGTISYSSDNRVATNAQLYLLDFNTTISLSKDTTYRLTYKPTSASNISIGEFIVNSSTQLGAMPGGTTMYRTHRTDGGSWTEDDTNVPQIGLIIDQIDDGTGSGSGSKGGPPPYGMRFLR